MDSCSDVTGKGQEVSQDLSLALWEVGLKDGHLLLGVLHFSTAILGIPVPQLPWPWTPSPSAGHTVQFQPEPLTCFSLSSFHLLTSYTFSANVSCWINPAHYQHTVDFPSYLPSFSSINKGIYGGFMCFSWNTKTQIPLSNVPFFYWLDFMDISRSQ